MKVTPLPPSCETALFAFGAGPFVVEVYAYLGGQKRIMVWDTRGESNPIFWDLLGPVF